MRRDAPTIRPTNPTARGDAEWFAQSVGRARSTLRGANHQSAIRNHQSQAGYENGQVAASDPNHPNRFLFTGREFDKETGLYYYRARYYNASIGRFLQTDPARDGTNLYAYCRNNPPTLTDPSGTMTAPFPAPYVPLPPAPSPLSNPVSMTVYVGWSLDQWPYSWLGTNWARVTLTAERGPDNTFFQGYLSYSFEAPNNDPNNPLSVQEGARWGWSITGGTATVSGPAVEGGWPVYHRRMSAVVQVSWTQGTLGLVGEYVPLADYWWPYRYYMSVYIYIWVNEDGSAGYTVSPSSNAWEWWNFKINGNYVRPAREGEEAGPTVSGPR